ncbi:MAG: SUMF1/EgtB/PvdO family nonheme iron enzyme [Magnetococcales bacterium]|nr:SUMF1/EgtB/PvdO family nonheme iron enzyme [Magnetococcales bacterium]
MAENRDLSPDQAERMIRHFTPGYRMVRVLGSGSFGQVFLVTDDLAEVAVKVIPLKLRVQAGQEKESHEWHQLQYNWDRLNHASLVRIRSCHIWSATDDTDPVAEYGLVYMDYWPVDLYDCVKQLAEEGRLTPARQYALLWRLAVLLQRLIEDTGLISTDLKLENVMVTACRSGPPQLAMIDLGGICEARLADYYRVISTDFYMAPELHDRSINMMDEPVLVYSFGIIGLFVLEGGRWPVAEYDYLKPLLPILREQGGPDWSPATRQAMPECIRIIETCLRESRRERYPTMAAVAQALQGAYQARVGRDCARIAGTLSPVVAGLPAHKGALLRHKMRDVWREPLTGMEFLWVPPGKFWMGQAEEETRVLRQSGDAAHFAKWYARELPRHRVELDGFWMGRLPVTRGQFAWFVEEFLFLTDREQAQFALRSYVSARESMEQWNWQTTRFQQDDSHPAVFISWFDAMQFTRWLSRRTGLLCTLPTEAQWEYACRGGARDGAPFCFGHTIRTDQANYYGGSVYGAGKTGIYRQGTTAGGQFPSNHYGLHDMHGNVWEWCQDQYEEDFYGRPQARQRNPVHQPAIGYRIKRGGSWCCGPDMLRSAYRGGGYPNVGKDDTGFRLVLSG